MHIILLPSRLAKARSLNITSGHVALCAVLGLVLMVSTAAALFVLSLRYADRFGVAGLEALLTSAQQRDLQSGPTRLNLDAMAVRLSQMQAQLARLDALGERVSSLAGLKPAEFRFTDPPGRGGSLATSAEPLSMDDLDHQLQALSRQMEARTDQLETMAQALSDARAGRSLLPGVTAADASWTASGFGWRIDPFTGQRALHEGMDFIAEPGTPVLAAAGGVVIHAGFHAQYGNMVDIDHGKDLVTRYAHAAALYVRTGDVVTRGTRIADVGSTGRSTGPHLHFEVRYKGMARNPAKFLRASAR